MDLVERTQEFSNFQQNLFLSASLNLIVWGIFYFVVVIFIIYSALLLYHWLKYGKEYKAVQLVMFAYFGVSVILISFMLGAAYTIA